MAAVAALILPLGATVPLATTASASPVLGVTATQTTTVTPSSTTTLSGLAVTGAGSVSDVQITVATDLGSLSVQTTTGLTLAYGNSWSGTASVTFDGAPGDVNAALGSVQLVQSAASGASAHITIAALPNQSNAVFSPVNGHFYRYVSAPGISWDTARTAAAASTFLGQQGYLASIPSDAVNGLISSRIPGATNVWFGAESTDSTDGSRTWKWVDGPLSGNVVSDCGNWTGACDFTNDAGLYHHWSNGEPNNAGGQRAWNDPLCADPEYYWWGDCYQTSTTPHSGEWVAVTNWGGVGLWNDLPPTTGGASGYVAEYGDQASGSTGFTGVVSASSTVAVQSPPPTAPSVPQNVSVTAGSGQATVVFDVPASDGRAGIGGYRISTDGGSAWATIVAGPANGHLSYTITGLTNGTTYHIAVLAYNEIDDGPASVPVDLIAVTVPDAPTQLTVLAGDANVTVSFAVPSFDGGSPVTGYEVSTDGGDSWATAYTVAAGPGGRTTTVHSLHNGTRYSVRLRARNIIGAGHPSAPISGTPVSPVSVPSAPTNVALVDDDQKIQVDFTTPSNDGGSPIIGYQLSIDGGLSWRWWMVTASSGRTLHLSVARVRNGVRYSVSVRAVNSRGAGSASAGHSALPNAPKLGTKPPTVASQVTPPADPNTYQGTVTATKYHDTSHGGTWAHPIPRLGTRQMTSGEAAVLPGFDFDSGTLNAFGRAEVRRLALHLRLAPAATCEGYADYAGGAGHELALSQQRAIAVCRALLADGAHLRTSARGYGSARPVVIGGIPSSRAANRRVVVLITG